MVDLRNHRLMRTSHLIIYKENKIIKYVQLQSVNKSKFRWVLKF